MTVAELIAKLQEMPQDARVIISHGEYDWTGSFVVGSHSSMSAVYDGYANPVPREQDGPVALFTALPR